MKNLLGLAFGHKKEEKPKEKSLEYTPPGEKKPYNASNGMIDEIIRKASGCDPEKYLLESNKKIISF